MYVHFVGVLLLPFFDMCLGQLLTMVVLLVVSSVAWIRRGNGQIRENWINGQPSNGAELGRQIFDGVCLGILGLTGFECTSYSKRQLCFSSSPLHP